MKAQYDNQNVFAKIIRGDVPCEKVFEDENTLAFDDINSLAPVHVLVIPKMEVVSFYDFMEKATQEQVYSFFKVVHFISKNLGINETGFRMTSNHGEDAMQEVPHFHVHLLGKRKLGKIAS